MFKQPIIQNILIFSIIYITFVLRHKGLGFYEDDFFQITPYLNYIGKDVLSKIYYIFIDWPQGRPISFSTPIILSYLSQFLGGKIFLYLCLSTIHFINFVLAKRLFNLIYQNKIIATIGAFLFVFIPADTTHSFLLHAFHVHLSLTYILFAFIFLLEKKPIIPYFFLLCSTLSYEAPISIFFFAPLLLKLNKKTWITHSLKYFIVIGSVFSYRLFFLYQEPRVTFLTNEYSKAIKHIFDSLIHGPKTSLYSYLHPLIEYSNTYIWSWNQIGYLVPIILFILIGSIFYLIKDNSKIEKVGLKNDKELFYLLGVGLIFLFASYLTSVSHDPRNLMNRLTSVHFSSVIGNSIFICSLIMLFYKHFIFKRKDIYKYLSGFLVIGYFTYLSIYHFNIQLYYVSAWKQQQLRMQKIMELLPEPTGDQEISILYTATWSGKYTPETLSLLNVIVPQLLTTNLSLHQIFDINKTVFKKEIIKKGENLFLSRVDNYGYSDVNIEIPVFRDNTYLLIQDQDTKTLNYSIQKLEIKNKKFIVQEDPQPYKPISEGFQIKNGLNRYFTKIFSED